MDQRELQRLARIGAAARLQQLDRERADLLRLFPGLRALVPTASSNEAVSSTRKGAKRGRTRRMSAANRKAVSIRMKRYWAERRKAKGGTAAKGQR
jgi:hypothetical protein